MLGKPEAEGFFAASVRRLTVPVRDTMRMEVSLSAQPPPGNLEARFTVVKKGNTFRGDYKRLLCITDEGVGTQDMNFALTNFWSWASDDVKAIGLSKEKNAFTMAVRDHGREEQLVFVAQDRTEILTQLHNMRARKCPGLFQAPRFPAFKITREGGHPRAVTLEVFACQLRQVDSRGRVLSIYDFKTITAASHLQPSLEPRSDQCIVIERLSSNRAHIFKCAQWSQLLECMRSEMKSLLGEQLPISDYPAKAEDFLQRRQKTQYIDEDSGVKQFAANKKTDRSDTPLARVLKISGGKMAELDASSRALVSVQPMCDVFAIVRDQTDPKSFMIHFEDGRVREYSSSEREALLSCLLDAVKNARRQRQQHPQSEATAVVRDTTADAGLLTCGRASCCDEDVESAFMSLLLQTSVDDATMVKLLLEFGTHKLTVDTTATNARKREKLLLAMFQALDAIHTQTAGGMSANRAGQRCTDSTRYCALLKVIQSLLYTRSGYDALKDVKDLALLLRQALNKDDSRVQYQTVMLMVAVVTGCHDTRPTVITMNKRLLMRSHPLRKTVIERLKEGLKNPSGQLIVQGVLSFLANCVIKPFSDTTHPEDYKAVLQDLAGMGESLFQIFLQPATAVVKDAGQMMEVITRDSPPEVKTRIQSAALHEGALLKHLHLSLFASTSGDRTSSRTLVAMWSDGNQQVQELLQRIFPPGLLLFFDAPMASGGVSREPSRARLPHSGGESGGVGQLRGATVKTSKHRTNPNWSVFWDIAMQDHHRPDLIWNTTTRDELRVELEGQLTLLAANSEQSCGTQGWNHHDFNVDYPSLNNEKTVGPYFLRLLIDGVAEEDITKNVLSVLDEHGDPRAFFNDFFSRCLVDPDPYVKSSCLHVSWIVLRERRERLSEFRTTTQLVGWLTREDNPVIRDHLLQLLRELIRDKVNAREFLQADGVTIAIDCMTVAHWQNESEIGSKVLLTTSSDQDQVGSFRYKNGADGDEKGPVGINELVQQWEDGHIRQSSLIRMDGDSCWRELSDPAYRILRWRLISDRKFDQTNMTVIERADTCLEMLLDLLNMYEDTSEIDGEKIILTPMHLAKRHLSSPSVISHIAQMVLCGETALAGKACDLLGRICRHNVAAAKKLYKSGIFFFAFVTGLDTASTALLRENHLVQSFDEEEQEQLDAVAMRSAMGNLLPEGVLSQFEECTSSDEKVTQVYYGDFDTPELIWNARMRVQLIDEIKDHVAKFRLRLRDNPMSRYDYVCMPRVAYAELGISGSRHKLWCDSVYLRNFCDEVRFPDFVVNHPGHLLKSILSMWRQFGQGAVDDRPEDLGLVLDSQALIYSRCFNVVEKEQYAGYPMLISLLNGSLLSLKQTPMANKALRCILVSVPASVNGKEFCVQNNGLKVLDKVLVRCLELVTPQAPMDNALVAATCVIQILTCFCDKARSDVSVFKMVFDELKSSPTLIANIGRCHDFIQTSEQLQNALLQLVPMLAEDDALRDLMPTIPTLTPPEGTPPLTADAMEPEPN